MAKQGKTEQGAHGGRGTPDGGREDQRLHGGIENRQWPGSSWQWVDGQANA